MCDENKVSKAFIRKFNSELLELQERLLTRGNKSLYTIKDGERTVSSPERVYSSTDKTY